MPSRIKTPPSIIVMVGTSSNKNTAIIDDPTGSLSITTATNAAGKYFNPQLMEECPRS